ncbi:MAG: 3-hydroxyacyl-CoA dehydrogenase [Acidobacteria bacterium]|nr:3-hydroxyacyl-CoA dehydrogenase [Acidobacteriota bacterium]
MKKAVVLGAGTMGSRIAAHLANAGVDCLLLDLPTPGASTPAERSAVAAKALKALAKARPPAFFTAKAAEHLRVGNFEDDLERVADAEWVIEAVIEKFDVKRKLLEQVDRFRQPGSLVSSNTSGLPIAKLAEGLSADFQAHWLGTHFFNPPRHMRLLELIPTPATKPEVVDFVTEFCDRRLGKVVVRANDRPNFIANRIFLFAVMQTLHTMTEQGLTIEEVDALTGPLVGRPRMATFRLADFTGIDVCLYVARTLYELVPEDERREVYQPPDFLVQMVEKGIVGDKAGRGFNKKDSKAAGGRLVLDLETLQYRERIEPDFPEISDAKRLPTPGERVKAVLASDSRAGRFVWATLSELFLYAASRVPEVCDDIVALDAVMKSGFNWQRGIFELWNDIGVEETARRIEADGKPLPELVQRVLASPSKSFYGVQGTAPTYFDLASGEQRPIPPAPGSLELRRVRLASQPVEHNGSASVWDLGDGVALLELHSKANALDEAFFALFDAAMARTVRDFDALVIGNEGENFSVGANLQMILGLSLQSRWEELDQQLRLVQRLITGVRRMPKPVVAAIFSQTLAGGCEIALRADRVQAAAETYMGLVEVGVGLVPAAGGCAEVTRRYTAGLDAKDDVTAHMLSAFEMIGTAKVSNSAAEAREMRLLRASDGVTMNRDRLLAEAKKAAQGLATAGYEPPEETPILVGGRGVRAALELRLWMMRQAEWAGDYDVHVGKKLANVLAGGDLTEPAFVSEEYLLGLEREAFLSLCGEQKTQARIEHILKTGKPLRN